MKLLRVSNSDSHQQKTDKSTLIKLIKKLMAKWRRKMSENVLYFGMIFIPPSLCKSKATITRAPHLKRLFAAYSLNVIINQDTIKERKVAENSICYTKMLNSAFSFPH
ncbi:CLUMA_CG009728, isoform A [Clunio marinus]|uniref:CLUMA_CG009728, isoform A n=1 Tax=Clunio marinus TaxID=568069 RepID=A0A1J1I7P4_9DIPT|nr:CLUMA_CG009728, isoform A [Clunio marinus]